MKMSELGHATAELLQLLIRNACVNDGTPGSGQEIRNAETILAVLDHPRIEVERFEPAPGRVSIAARIRGHDPQGPSLCLNGHTDVVPADPDGWQEDPFGGSMVGNEIWGRGAIDMLNLTASMAIVVRHLADVKFQPRGDLTFLAVADEEAGSTFGSRWLAEHRPDLLSSDYTLTESGGVHLGSESTDHRILFRVAEKGVAWSRIRFRGTPTHGSTPFRSDSALAKAALAVGRLLSYRPLPVLHALWQEQVDALELPRHVRERLSDVSTIDAALAELDDIPLSAALHACSHTTLSPNVLTTPGKINVIPDVVDLDVDMRLMPGETALDIQRHLRESLGDLWNDAEITSLMSCLPTASAVDTPLWTAIQHAIAGAFPGARPLPQLHIGFTDARLHRELGSTAYGAGLLSSAITLGEFHSRFHGRNERVDLTSLSLTARFWHDVVREVLA